MTTERHASDGELVALLDGELETVGNVAAHVDTCAQCSARLSLIWHRSARLREVLGAATPPAVDADRLRPRPEQLARARARRRRLWSDPWLRAAAGITFIAGIAAATPARAWIIERVTGRPAASAPRDRGPSPAGQQPSTPPAQSAAPIVWFAPEANELLIQFSARAAGGSLTLVAGEERRSSAQIVAGAAGEAFLVLPAELRVRNAPSSIAEYQVTLSPVVRRVHVRLGEGTAAEIESVDVTSGMRRVIPLGAAERSSSPRRQR